MEIPIDHVKGMFLMMILDNILQLMIFVKNNFEVLISMINEHLVGYMMAVFSEMVHMYVVIHIHCGVYGMNKTCELMMCNIKSES